MNILKGGSNLLGENIRRIRKSKKMSINALSKESKVSLGYLSDLENNKFTNPTMDKLSKIANALNVSVSDFFDDKENLSNEENTTNESNIVDEDIRRIERARMKMTPKDKEKMMKILRSAFDDFFDD